MAGKWFSRIVTLAVWALAALSATWWSLKFVGANGSSVSATTVAAATPGSDPAKLARIFGTSNTSVSAAASATPVAMGAGTRFALVGVVASRASAGVALISVDGKAARPYRVGSQIEDSYTLKSVAARSAVLEPSSPAGAAFSLELPPLAGAAPHTVLHPSAVPLPASKPPGPVVGRTQSNS